MGNVSDRSGVKILYVENDEIVRAHVAKVLQEQSESVYTASDGREGYELFESIRPDILITDVTMPSMGGLELSQMAKNISPDIPIIITGTFDDENSLLRSIDIGIDKYILKPINAKKLQGALSDAIDVLEMKTKI